MTNSELKKGWFVDRSDRWGHGIIARGYVGANLMIDTVCQSDFDAIEPIIRVNLHRVNTEVRAILHHGGALTSLGRIVEIGFGNTPLDKDFEVILQDSGVVKCTVPQANKLLDRNLQAEKLAASQQKVMFYAPSLDSRMSFGMTVGGSPILFVDDKRVGHEFDSIEHLVGSVGLRYGENPDKIYISSETLANQILCDACMVNGRGYRSD